MEYTLESAPGIDHRMHGEIEAVRVVVGDALLDEIEGRQHPRQDFRTTDCLEYRRHTYSF